MIQVIMMIYISGIIMGGFSSNFTSLVASRVIQGIGISMLPTAFGIIKDRFPQGKLGIAVGIFTSMSAAGSVVGIVLGASIIENFGWRVTFFSMIPIIIGLWFVIRRFIYEDQRISRDADNNSNDDSRNRSKKRVMAMIMVVRPDP